MSQSRFNIEAKFIVRTVLQILLTAFLVIAWLPAQQPTPKGYASNGDVFLGWMKYAVHVQIRFLNGGHTTYGREQMKDITKELEAGLKCVQEKK